jgi:hypothetical protein
MVGGIFTLGLAIAGWIAAGLLGKNSPVRGFSDAVFLSVLLAGCAVTPFINPYGIRMPQVWFQLMDSPVLPKLIQEHAPVSLSDPVGLVIVFLGFLYLVALLGVLPQWPRTTWLIPVVWLYLACTRLRHGPLFAVTMVIAIGDMFPHIRWVQWLIRRGSEVCRIREPVPAEKRTAWMPYAIPAALVLTTILLQSLRVQVPIIGHGWVKLNPRDCPIELLPDLKAIEAEGPEGKPIFNEMLFSGFLIYYTPGLRVFIDDRCELYGDEQLLAYFDALQHRPEQVDRWADEYGFDIALTIKDSAFDRYLRAGNRWDVIRTTPAATLYRRRIGDTSSGKT